jgi:hypothetical protein
MLDLRMLYLDLYRGLAPPDIVDPIVVAEDSERLATAS